MKSVDIVLAFCYRFDMEKETPLQNIGIRLEGELKERVEAASRRNRRSVNQQIVFWLETAVDDDETSHNKVAFVEE